jgi:hypothetical protein
MTNAGLDAKDAATAIVYTDSNLSGVYSVKLKSGEETKVLDEMLKITAVTVGLVIAIHDREADKRLLTAIPFLQGDQALKWLSEILDRQEKPTVVN